MVTSVNRSVLAALQAREHALANAAADPTRPPAAGPDQPVVYAGSPEAPSLSAVLSVQDSLNRAASISDVGINAGQAISGLLSLAREKVAAARDAAGEPGQQDLNDVYQQLLQTIDQLAHSAAFQGVKMLQGPPGGDLPFKADVSGETTLALKLQDFTVGGPVIGLAGTDLLGSSEDLASLLGQVDAAGGAVSGQLSQMQGQGAQIQAHLGVVGRLQGALAADGANDLDADGARLQALQIQQLLAGAGQGIANQAPQAVLALFRA